MTTTHSVREGSQTVLLFVPTLHSGGAERVALLLAQGMLQRGVDVRLVTAESTGDFASLIPPGIPVIDLSCRKPIAGLRAISSVVDRTRSTWVVCFGMHTGIAATLSRAIYGWKAKIIVRSESNLPLEWADASLVNRIIGPALSRWTAARTKVVVVSNRLRAPTIEYLRVAPERVVVIPNPVFATNGGNEVHANIHPWLAHSRLPVIVAVGRLEHVKGFDILIEAFRLASKSVECRLIIYGTGSLEPVLREQVNTAGISDKVDLPGFTPSPVAQMREAKAFVLSSRYEGFGLVLVEALAAGTQVIATDCDYGPREILNGGEFGTLVPVSDPQALATAILGVIRGTTCRPRPPEEWFGQFRADVAVERHLLLMEDKP